MKLPDGVTVNGKQHTEMTADHATEVRSIVKSLRLRSCKGGQARTLRVEPYSTKIYTEEEIRRIKMKKFFDKNKEWMLKNPEARNSDLCLAALGMVDDYKSTPELREIIHDTIGKDLGHNISTYMKTITGLRFSTLFVNSTGTSKRRYRMTDYGIMIGVGALRSLSTQPLPKDYTVIRLKLGQLRRNAEKVGIKESIFDRYIIERLQKLYPKIEVPEPSSPETTAPLETPETTAPSSVSGFTFKIGFENGLVVGEVTFK